MKYSYIMAALAAPVVLAAPAKRQSTNIDTTVLQFALTLEHLENVFYKGALQKFSQADFLKAGYGADYYNNLRYIASDEQSHVLFLQAALTAAGQTPTAACTYNFPYTDVQSFITLSSILEGVGTSAYLGGAPLITNKNYLTAAGSILVTEALHTSQQRSAVNEVPFASPYGTPLDPTSVYTLASAFIVSCPSTNPTLPFTPFPALSLSTTAGTCEEPDCSPMVFEKRDWQSWEESSSSSSSSAEAPAQSGYNSHDSSDNKDNKDNGNNNSYSHEGAPAATTVYITKGSGSPTATATVTVTASSYGNGHNSAYPSATSTPASSTKNQPALQAGQSATFTAVSAVPSGSYLTFVSGLTVVSVPASVNGNSASAKIPTSAMGQTYVFVTKSAANGTALDGSSVLFGPAILEVTPQPPVIDFSEA